MQKVCICGAITEELWHGKCINCLYKEGSVRPLIDDFYQKGYIEKRQIEVLLRVKSLSDLSEPTFLDRQDSHVATYLISSGYLEQSSFNGVNRKIYLCTDNGLRIVERAIEEKKSNTHFEHEGFYIRIEDLAAVCLEHNVTRLPSHIMERKPVIIEGAKEKESVPVQEAKPMINPTQELKQQQPTKPTPTEDIRKSIKVLDDRIKKLQSEKEILEKGLEIIERLSKDNV